MSEFITTPGGILVPAPKIVSQQLPPSGQKLDNAEPDILPPITELNAKLVVSKFFESTKFCGCGDRLDFIAWLRELLTAIQTNASFEEKSRITGHVYDSSKRNSPSGLYWLAWYWLDVSGLTEHGGNVTGGWLTEAGKELLAAFNMLGPSKSYEAANDVPQNIEDDIAEKKSRHS